MRAVILQPTYLPWMGYFGMIDIADVFVFYDDTQFVKQSWQQRNKIKTQNGWMWLIVPVFQNFGQEIKEVKINNNINWAEKHWKSIMYNYSKAPFFNEYASIFESMYTKRWECLVELNVALIKKITEILGLKTRFMFSSELNVKGAKTDRLIDILTKIDADVYISGPAAKTYIEIDKFKREGIMLYWYEFNHPTYPQLHGDFIPYLSVVDLLFNTGNEALDVIRRGGEYALKKAEWD